MVDATHFDSLSELRDAVRSVMKSPGFQKWNEVVNAQIQGRHLELLHPAENMDKLVKGEFMKGEVTGMMGAVQLWKQLIEDLETEIDRINQEKDNANVQDAT
jgi:hypothetical protein